MPMTYTINAEQGETINAAMRTATDAKNYCRLQALDLRAKGYENDEIARITGYAETYISELVGKFMKNGIERIARDRRLGGNHRLLSAEAEASFLGGLSEKALSGELVTVSQIRSEYDQLVGKKSSIPTIYNVLERHDWRKVVPRQKHPKKASDEDIESSKKLTKNTIS